jgi:hypothetical protein
MYRGIERLSSKAKLTNGDVVTYDQCSTINTCPQFGPAFQSVYVGRGIIVEVDGESYPVDEDSQILDFWTIENRYNC